MQSTCLSEIVTPKTAYHMNLTCRLALELTDSIWSGRAVEETLISLGRHLKYDHL